MSGRTQQQQRPHEVQQPQPRQEACPGSSVGGGGRVPAHQSMEAERSKSVVEVLNNYIE